MKHWRYVEDIDMYMYMYIDMYYAIFLLPKFTRGEIKPPKILLVSDFVL